MEEIPNADTNVYPHCFGYDGKEFKVYTLEEAKKNLDKILFAMSILPNSDLDLSFHNYKVYLASPTDIASLRYEAELQGVTLTKTLFGKE